MSNVVAPSPTDSLHHRHCSLLGQQLHQSTGIKKASPNFPTGLAAEISCMKQLQHFHGVKTLIDLICFHEGNQYLQSSSAIDHLHQGLARQVLIEQRTCCFNHSFSPRQIWNTPKVSMVSTFLVVFLEDTMRRSHHLKTRKVQFGISGCNCSLTHQLTNAQLVLCGPPCPDDGRNRSNGLNPTSQPGIQIYPRQRWFPVTAVCRPEGIA